MDFATLKKCTELRDAHIVAAVSSSEAMEALLARFAEIAGPGTGGPLILAALARLGTTSCDWIDGELRIQITGDASRSKIAVSSSIGAGFSEKVLADTVLRVPLDEFARGIERAPRLIEPLRAKTTATVIVLTVSEEVRKTSLPPPMVQIDPASFMVVGDVPAVPRMKVPIDIPEDVLPMAAPPRSQPRPAGGAHGVPVLRKRIRDDDPKK